jgi:NAD(P)-dependent dehydrogenase (short-subunit alcohol dehydrogenase family)
MDVTDASSVEAGFDAAEGTLGPIDAVIANAGVGHGGMAIDLPVAAFDDIMAVNVRGAFLTAREAARRMAARRTAAGRIVLIASTGGLRPLPGLAAYSASKAAVIMLGQSLAREWIGLRINVNILCPGYIRTELNHEWFDSPAGQKQIDRFPRKRLMAASDLNAILLHLVSEDSAAITGSVFKIDDGQMP